METNETAPSTDLYDTPDESLEYEEDLDEEIEIPWLEGRKQLEIPSVSPLDSLLKKLDAWLLVQPEFFLILNSPRRARREAIQQVSKHLLTFPARGKAFGGFDPS